MNRTHLAKLSIITLILALTGCIKVKGEPPVIDKAFLPCNSKPNCVSTEDPRSKFNIAPFILENPNITLDQIEQVALTLPRTKLASKNKNSLYFECSSRIMGFIDDLIISKQGDQLIVRSESRVGYYDFGVNRERTDLLREKLLAAHLIK